ncbi:GNAT family N-acetyltransferase [Rufibacter latericius]|uniref:N-acetyltransferase n=1 Tax=Rufibacter latericius TaxID=2487040 RepID=A0A3M9M8Y1_9BACT|nr:GNAT family protein [Rufibacter latericius]RNI22014.1 N-acetyltransferase [Rufibacter latericius]
MDRESLSVRELAEQDIPALADYWLKADDAFLEGMGVDLSKLPERDAWEEMLRQQIKTPLAQKQSYCLIWQLEGQAVGHSNANKITFGQEAYMHLHLWKPDHRTHGLGTAFVRQTLPYFFRNLELKKLYCEPYALNPAPHKTLAKVGFTQVAEYITTPGWINFEQLVKLWELTRESFESLPINHNPPYST